MNIVRWSPINDIDRWFDGMMPVVGNVFTPAVDVYQTDKAVVVEAPLAGVDPEKVEIAIENDMLTIEGSMEKTTEVDDKNYYRKEIRSGSFHRSVALPVAVKGDAAEAVFEKGMLRITLPKADVQKSKTIKVQVKK